MFAAMAEGDARPARTNACVVAGSPLRHQIRKKRHPIGAGRNLNRTLIQLAPAGGEQVSHPVERKARVEDGRHRVPPVLFDRPIEERLVSGVRTKRVPHRCDLRACSHSEEYGTGLQDAVADQGCGSVGRSCSDWNSRWQAELSGGVTLETARAIEAGHDVRKEVDPEIELA